MTTYSLNSIGHGVLVHTGSSQNCISILNSDAVRFNANITVGNTDEVSECLFTVACGNTHHIIASKNTDSNNDKQLVISHKNDQVQIQNMRSGASIRFVTPVEFNTTITGSTPGVSDDSTKLATTAFVKRAINNLIDGAPGTLDTLNELATALNSNDSDIANLITLVNKKWTQDDTKITQWDTAYSWNNHADAGYLKSETNDLSSSVTWATVPDAYISATSILQHQIHLRINFDQILNLENHPQISNKAPKLRPIFMVKYK